jgi:hypothetical protein
MLVLKLIHIIAQEVWQDVEYFFDFAQAVFDSH